MLKRQSTTVKVTRNIVNLLNEFMKVTRNGVMLRAAGEEIALYQRLWWGMLPKGLCIYRRTLNQVAAIVGRFSEFSGLRVRYLGETATDFVYTVDSGWSRRFLLVSTATWLARDPEENWYFLDNLPQLFELTETGFRLKCGVYDEQFAI